MDSQSKVPVIKMIGDPLKGFTFEMGTVSQQKVAAMILLAKNTVKKTGESTHQELDEEDMKSSFPPIN